MKGIPARCAAALLFVGLWAACVSGDSPTDPSRSGVKAVLAVVPTFPGQDPRNAETAAINLIRIRVLTVPGDAQVAEVFTTVNPEASEWDLAVEVPLSNDPSLRYVLEIELIHESGGVRSVEWSGRTGPLTLTGGASTEIRQVEVVRGPLDNLAVTGLALAGPATVREQSTFAISADVTTNGTANPTVFWASLDPSVATVGPDGAGVALAPGVARIRAEAGSLVAEHELLVLGVPAEVVVTPAEVVVDGPGDEVVVEAEVLDVRGVALADEDVTWSVADERVLANVGGGRFRALAGGETEVTATSVTDPSLAGTARVTVPIVATTLIVVPAQVTLTRIGATATLEAQAFAGDGAPVFGLLPTWSSSNPAVATVSAQGVVTAVGPGEAVITAEAEDTPSGSTPATEGGSQDRAGATISAGAVVRVVVGAQRVEVTPSGAELREVGATQQFSVRAFDALGDEVVDPGATWTTSNTAVATVNGAGLATAVGEGTTTVSAQVGDLVGSAQLTVDLVIGEVLVTPTPLTLAPGETAQLTAQALADNGTTLPATFTWETSDPAVAQVGPQGLVTAVYPGSVEISAWAEGTRGVASVTVALPLGPADSYYETLGNTQLVAGAFTEPTTAHVLSPDNLLTATPGLVITSTGAVSTTQGGSADVEADGDFSYNPPLGFQGTDAFQFTVEGGATATVQIEVIGMAWYHDNRYNGDGRSTNPLNDASNAGGPGDILFVHFGDGSTYLDGFVLQDGQALIGEGAGLDVPGLGTIVPPGPRPRIGGSDWDAIELGDNTTVAGVIITSVAGDAISGVGVGNVTVDQVHIDNDGGPTGGVYLVNPTGSYTFTDLEILSVSGDAFQVEGGDAVIDVSLGSSGIAGASGRSLHVENTTGGSISVDGDEIIEDGTGVLMQNNLGSVTVTSLLTVDDPAGTGIDIRTNTGDVTLTDVDVTTTDQTGIFTQANSGAVTLNGQVNTTGAPGLDAQSVSGPSGPVNATFSSYVVYNDGGLSRGRGLFAARNPGVIEIDYLDITSVSSPSGPRAIDLLDMSYGGAFRVLDPSSRAVCLAGDAFSVTAGPLYPGGQTYEVDVTFGTLEATGPNTSYGAGGIALIGATGSVSVSNGSIASTGRGIYVGDGGNVALTYGGTVTSTSGIPVSVVNQLGGNVIFNGPVTASDEGIVVTDNTNTTVRFNGQLNLQTGVNPAFTATGGGTVEATDAGNFIATTTGQGVLIADSDIGPAGVVFGSVSVDGAGTGIELNNTGSQGGFALVGASDPGTGGTLANTGTNGIYANGVNGLYVGFVDIDQPTTWGVYVENSTDVVLEGVGVVNGGFDGVYTYGVQDLTVIDSDIGVNATGDAFRIQNPLGNQTFSGVTATSAGGAGLSIGTSAGTSVFDIQGGTFDGSGNQGVTVGPSGTASLTFNMSGSSASNNGDYGIIFLVSGSSMTQATLDGANTFSNNSVGGVGFANFGTAQLLFDVNGNTITGQGSLATYLQPTGLAAGLFSGWVRNNNYVGGGIVAGALGIESVTVVEVSGNTIASSFAGPSINIYNTDASPSAAPSMDVTVDGNLIAPAAGQPGVRVMSQQTGTICTDVRNNAVSVSSGEPGIEFRQLDSSTFFMERLLGGSGSTGVPGTVSAQIVTDNPAVSTLLNDVLITTQIDGAPVATCQKPGT